MTLAAVATLSVAGCKKQPTTPPDGDGQEADEDEEASEDVEAPEEEEGDDTEAAAVLDKASFDETIHEHFSEVSDCYVIALESNPELQGKLNAEFKFDAEGKVLSVTALDDSTLKDEGLLACINAAATTWSFGVPAHGEMTLRYTYNLAPAG